MLISGCGGRRLRAILARMIRFENQKGVLTFGGLRILMFVGKEGSFHQPICKESFSFVPREKY